LTDGILALLEKDITMQLYIKYLRIQNRHRYYEIVPKKENVSHAFINLVGNI